MTELERMTQAEGYINRYFEFEDGVNVSQENKEYLKTYIREIESIEKEFNFKNRFLRGIGISAGGALVLFILLIIPLHKGMLWIVPVVAFAAVLIAGTVLFYSTIKYKLDAAKEHQKEVNEGIAEQIEIIDLRIQQLEKQRDDYLAALGSRIDFMDLDMDYMKNIGKIKSFIENGSAETCEDAVYMYEQSALMDQMTSIMTASEHKTEEVSREKNIERFGDPLKIIKENKKKKKKGKKYMM